MDLRRSPALAVLPRGVRVSLLPAPLQPPEVAAVLRSSHGQPGWTSDRRRSWCCSRNCGRVSDLAPVSLARHLPGPELLQRDRPCRAGGLLRHRRRSHRRQRVRLPDHAQARQTARPVGTSVGTSVGTAFCTARGTALSIALSIALGIALSIARGFVGTIAGTDGAQPVPLAHQGAFDTSP